LVGHGRNQEQFVGGAQGRTRLHVVGSVDGLGGSGRLVTPRATFAEAARMRAAVRTAKRLFMTASFMGCTLAPGGLASPEAGIRSL
jgi:hypothetical protein